MKKLCWDYRGPDAKGTAEHFEKHLVTFLERHQLGHLPHGVEELSRVFASTWVQVPDEEASVLQSLRPHRTLPVEG